MTLSKMMLATGVLAFAGIISAASIDLASPAYVGQTELKAGHYKVDVQGDKAVFKSGKEKVEVPVTVDKGTKKFDATSVESTGSKIQTIHLGGTTTSITIKQGASAATAVGNGTGTGL